MVLNQVIVKHVSSLQQSVVKSLQSSRELQTLMSCLLARCSPVLVDTEWVQCLTEMALATLGEQDSEEEEKVAIVDILKLMEVRTMRAALP